MWKINFFENINELEQSLQNSGADLALIGVKPTYPSEKYGYIVPNDSDELHEKKLSVY